MPYIPDSLKTEAFIGGKVELYNALINSPDLRMVPIDKLNLVRRDLHSLGYITHMRFRGPHKPGRDTIKKNARAFTVYIRE